MLYATNGGIRIDSNTSGVFALNRLVLFTLRVLGTGSCIRTVHAVLKGAVGLCEPGRTISPCVYIHATLSKLPRSMANVIKLLIVEDDMIIAAKISMQLTRLGYEVTAIVPRGPEAVRQAEENRPDIILLDINLKGPLDGIETAHQLNKLVDVPIIYVTANTDEATFDRAKETRPYAFIGKPIKNIDLQRAIELTISRLTDNHHQNNEPEQESPETTPFVLSDRIFVRHNQKMVKIFVAEILYLEADRNYCHLVTADHTYLLTATLKAMEDKLAAPHFLRVHRSYVVNLLQIDEVGESHIGLAGKTIPLSYLLRDELLKRIHLL